METSLTLLDRLKQGNDQEAWRILNDLYLPLIASWIKRFSLGTDDRDDLTQEIFLQLSQNIHKFQHPERVGSFRKWFKSMTINCVRNFIRKKGNKKIGQGGTTVLDLLKQYEDPKNELNQQWDRQHEERLMEYLLEFVKTKFSQQTWNAFFGSAIEKRRASDIALELGISTGAVHTAKSRVLAELRKVGKGMLDSL